MGDNRAQMDFFGFLLTLVPTVFLGRVLVNAGMRSTALIAAIWVVTASLVAVLGAATAAVGILAYVLLWPVALGLVGLAAWLVRQPDDRVVWSSLIAATLVMALGVVGVLTSTAEFHGPQWMMAGFAAAALYFSDAHLRAQGR